MLASLIPPPDQRLHRVALAHPRRATPRAPSQSALLRFSPRRPPNPYLPSSLHLCCTDRQRFLCRRHRLHPRLSSRSVFSARPRTRWLDWLVALVVEELTPNSRRLRTTLRMAVIGTVGAALMAACHVQNQLGYLPCLAPDRPGPHDVLSQGPHLSSGFGPDSRRLRTTLRDVSRGALDDVRVSLRLHRPQHLSQCRTGLGASA